MKLEILFRLIFFIGILTVIFQRYHLLIVLLRLERVTLIIVLILIFYLKERNDVYLYIMILTFGAIEASLGLSLLVFIARKIGRDLISRLTLSKC